MARRRNVIRLGIPTLIVAALSVVALWRIGPPTPAHPVPVVANIVGREASLEHIEIRELTGTTTFWAGGIAEQPVFAVEDGNVKRAPGVRIVPGREVTLIGVVRPVPAEDEMMRRWRLDAATARSVKDVGTYLEVREIR